MLRKNRLIWENIYELEEAEVVLLGVPFDGTCTGLPGTRLAPARIREDFDLFVAGYEPGLGDLSDVKLYDAGDVDVVHGSYDETFMRIYNAVKEIRSVTDAPLLTIGGEHSITLPVVKALSEEKTKFGYLCYDAHLDLLEEYNGYKNSHTCVNRHVYDLLGNVEIRGARAGSREEWEFNERMKPAKERVYLSIDVDVMDVPSGTPVPGGMQLRDLWAEIKKKNIVSADIVEYNPMVGHSTVPAELLKRLILKAAR